METACSSRKALTQAIPFATLSATSGAGSLNRLLWKGYLYDADLGCYCLGRRHYDPFALRFLEPDDIAYLDPSVPGGVNPYAYCLNDPVLYADAGGEDAVLVGLIIGAIVGAGIGFGAVAYEDYRNDGLLFNSGEGDPRWYDYLLGTAVGGLIGGILGAGAGYLSTFSWTANLPMIGVVNRGGIAAVGLTRIGIVISGGEIVGTLGAAGLLGIGAMYSKPNSGRIRFSDGTGKDPVTGEPITDENKAREIYRLIKDPIEKMKWKRWMKGMGWIRHHQI